MSTDRRAPLPLWLFLKRKERKRKGTRPQRHGGAIIPERPSPGQDPLPACLFGPGAAPVTCRSKGNCRLTISPHHVQTNTCQRERRKQARGLSRGEAQD